MSSFVSQVCWFSVSISHKKHKNSFLLLPETVQPNKKKKKTLQWNQFVRKLVCYNSRNNLFKIQSHLGIWEITILVVRSKDVNCWMKWHRKLKMLFIFEINSRIIFEFCKKNILKIFYCVARVLLKYLTAFIFESLVAQHETNSSVCWTNSIAKIRWRHSTRRKIK